MSIARVVRRVAALLEKRQEKIVFAESCTGGLVSGALTAVPGISRFHCGAMVVYRDETKAAFLGIAPGVIREHGAVSEVVARKMAGSVLMKTREADVGVSVTGHLGPDAPKELDGRVYVGIAQRTGRAGKRASVAVHSLECRHVRGRVPRQRWVVEQVLKLLATHLSQDDAP